MNTYRLSNGDRISKSVIDQRVRKAKEQRLKDQVDQYGYNFCERTGLNASSTTLDCSHIVSVKYCQDIGYSELAYNVVNIEILSRKAHEDIEAWPNHKRVGWLAAKANGLSYEDYNSTYEDRFND